ncbi:hypothetical protein FQN57_007154 [Myotisia sp. PD_48]|nr:hypothetical protein FQN57_007154 [Myotisia sp. PD_48]
MFTYVGPRLDQYGNFKGTVYSSTPFEYEVCFDTSGRPSNNPAVRAQRAGILSPVSRSPQFGRPKAYKIAYDHSRCNHGHDEVFNSPPGPSRTFNRGNHRHSPRVNLRLYHNASIQFLDPSRKANRGNLRHHHNASFQFLDHSRTTNGGNHHHPPKSSSRGNHRRYNNASIQVRGPSRTVNRGNQHGNIGDAYDMLPEHTDEDPLPDWDACIADDPYTAAHWAGRADCYIQRHQYTKAVADLEEATRLEPENEMFAIELAEVYTLLGRPEKSLPIYSMSSLPNSYSNWRVARKMEKNIAKAEKALEYDDTPEVLRYLDEAKAELGYLVEMPLLWRKLAIQAYLNSGDEYSLEQVQSLANEATIKDASLLELQARAAYSQGKIDEALEHLRIALKIDPYHSHAQQSYQNGNLIFQLKRRGVEAFRDERFGDAIDFFSQVLNLDTDNIEIRSVTYYERARVFYHLQEYDKTIKDCSDALNLKHSNPKAQRLRALAYATTGQWGCALEDFECVARLWPDDREVQEEIRNVKSHIKEEKLPSNQRSHTKPSSKAKPRAQLPKNQRSHTKPLSKAKSNKPLKPVSILRQMFSGTSNIKKTTGRGSPKFSIPKEVPPDQPKSSNSTPRPTHPKGSRTPRPKSTRQKSRSTPQPDKTPRPGKTPRPETNRSTPRPEPRRAPPPFPPPPPPQGKPQDYYTVLGVQVDATPTEIKQAYHKLALKYHPDKTGGDDTMFKEIVDAYAILKDPEARTSYDRKRSRRGGP